MKPDIACKRTKKVVGFILVRFVADADTSLYISISNTVPPLWDARELCLIFVAFVKLLKDKCDIWAIRFASAFCS